MSAFLIRCLVLPITFTALKSFSRSGHYGYFLALYQKQLFPIRHFRNSVKTGNKDTFRCAKKQWEETCCSCVTRPREFSVVDCCGSILPILVCVVCNENDHPGGRYQNYCAKAPVRKDTCNIYEDLKWSIYYDENVSTKRKWMVHKTMHVLIK